MESANQPLCPFCQSPLVAGFQTCPHCGKKIQEPTIPIGEQIGLYALSFLLPPFGLIPGIKNAVQKEPKRKKMGIIAIILTIVSLSFSVWLSSSLFTQINSSLNSELKDYNNLNLLK